MQYIRNMEDGEKPQEEQEVAVIKDEVRSSFDEFLKGDLKSVDFHTALDRLLEANSKLIGYLGKNERQKLIAQMAESYATNLISRQQQWLDNLPNNSIKRGSIAATAVAAFMPWKAMNEQDQMKRYEEKNPVPLVRGELWNFNQMLIMHGLVEMPKPPESRVAKLRNTLGNLTRPKSASDTPQKLS